MVHSLFRFRTRTFLLVAILLPICGCGSRLVPVKGTATVDGKPLPAGNVLFVPDKDKGNSSTVEARSVISDKGTYELTTGNQVGARPGWYKVVVVGVEPTDLNNPTPAPSKSLIAAKYNDLKTTDIQIEVKADASPGAYDLKLSGP